MLNEYNYIDFSFDDLSVLESEDLVTEEANIDIKGFVVRGRNAKFLMAINNKDYLFSVKPTQVIRFKQMIKKNRGSAIQYLRRVNKYKKAINYIKTHLEKYGKPYKRYERNSFFKA